MKRPFCKVCKNHHYSHEPHIWAAPDEVGVVERPVRTDQELARAAIAERVKRGEISDQAAAVALTVAQRSKSYRERLGDEYRKRNAERMARKREK